MRGLAGLLACFLLGLPLAACQDLMDHVAAPVDPKSFLEKQEGPKVEGMEEAMLNAAHQAETSRDFKRAGQMYAQLIGKYPAKTDYVVARGEALRRAGDYANAIKLFDEVITKEPGNAAALEGKGLALMAMGEFPSAGKQFEQVMTIDKNRWRTINGIGVLFALKGMTKEALAYFAEAEKHSTDSPSVLNNKALVTAMDGNMQEATSLLHRARKLVPADSAERTRLDLNLALIYGIAGEMDEAEKYARPHLSDPALYNNLGLYAHLAKDESLAKGYLNKALVDSPVYYDKAWTNLEMLGGER